MQHPPEGKAIISTDPNRLYKCPVCYDIGYVAGRPMERHGASYPTARACPACELGRGIKARYIADAEAKRVGGRTANRRVTPRERKERMEQIGQGADLDAVRRAEWYGTDGERD